MEPHWGDIKNGKLCCPSCGGQLFIGWEWYTCPAEGCLGHSQATCSKCGHTATHPSCKRGAYPLPKRVPRRFMNGARGFEPTGDGDE